MLKRVYFFGANLQLCEAWFAALQSREGMGFDTQGFSALATLENTFQVQTPDLLILDCDGREMSRVAVLRWISKCNECDVAILLVSVDDEWAVSSPALLGSSFVSKACDLPAFLSAVDKALSL